MTEKRYTLIGISAVDLGAPLKLTRDTSMPLASLLDCQPSRIELAIDFRSRAKLFDVHARAGDMLIGPDYAIVCERPPGEHPFHHDTMEGAASEDAAVRGYDLGKFSILSKPGRFWITEAVLDGGATRPVPVFSIERDFADDWHRTDAVPSDPARKTPEQIEDLKRQWLAAPIWDIEDTEGFEAHRHELLAWRLARDLDGLRGEIKEAEIAAKTKRPRMFMFADGSEVAVDDCVGIDATAERHGLPHAVFQLSRGGFMPIGFYTAEERTAELARMRAFRDGRPS